MAGKTTTTKKTTARRATPAKAKTSTVRKESPSIKQEKPIFRAGTWIAILVLAALIGFTFYLNREKEPVAAEGTLISEPSPLFDAADGAPSSIEIKPADGESVRIARNAENAWAIELPFEAEANQGLAEAAASQISALQIISPIDAGADPDIFGLKTPAFILTIEFASGKKHTLEVGSPTPTNSGYYVRIDRDKMAITDLSGIDSLLQLVFFPPYLNTPTPTAIPATETPVATPELSVTPTP